MAAHACLKNELMEDEKYQNLMTWLKYYFIFSSPEPKAHKVSL